MSEVKDSRGRYLSNTNRRTATPGVYERGRGDSVYYLVQTRPDGHRKVMRRFETYEEACDFKRSWAPTRRTPKPRAKRVPTSIMSFLLLDPCVYCGGEADGFDHIVPRSSGGEHDWTNLAPACRSCNSQKHTRPLLFFLLARRTGELASGRRPRRIFEDDSMKPLFDLLGV